MATIKAWSCVLLLLFMPTWVFGCASPYSFTYDHSSFYFTYIDEPCGYFTFDKCTWRVCTQWKRCGDSTCCANYVFEENTDWDFCTRHICDPDVDHFPQHFDTVKECQLYHWRRKMAWIYGIVFGLGLGVPLGVGLPLFLIWIAPIIRNAFLRHKNGGGRVRRWYHAIIDTLAQLCNRQGDENERQESGRGNETQVELPPSRWDSQNHLRYPGQQCSICLTARPLLQLRCGHAFHVSCILNYIARQRKCPLCRTRNLEPARIACEICRQSTRLIVSIGREPELRTARHLCHNCNRIS